MKESNVSDEIDDDFGLDAPDDKGIDDLQEEDYDNDLFSDDYGMDFDDNLGSTMNKQSDLLKNLTNFSPFIKEKVNGWLGLRWDETAQKYVKDQNIEPIMNTKCAAWCIDYLKIYARQNNLITNISKEDYTNIMIDVIDVV